MKPLNLVLALAAAGVAAGMPLPLPASSGNGTLTTLDVAKAAAVRTASDYVGARAAQHPLQTFQQLDAQPGPSGSVYVSYSRKYRDLPVLGGDFVVATTPDGQRFTDPLAQPRAFDVDTTPRVAASNARTKAILKAGLRETREVSAPSLLVFAPPGAEPVLAWKVTVSGEAATGPSIQHVYVNAHSGAVLASMEQVMRGSGNGYYYDATIDTRRTSSGYEMADPTRTGLFCSLEGNGPVKKSTDQWGNGGGMDRETACVDAYYAAQKQWDMLREWLGRNGFDGKGKGFPALVHLTNVNAYWNGHNTAFGQTKDAQRKLTNIDIVAHEFGHAIFQFTPGGFDGYGETYQLNEGNGDIFGAITEHFANHPADPPDYDYSGESNPFGRGAERIMYNPFLSPRKMPNCWSPELKDVEIHDGSGPISHWFYLIAEGSNPGGGKPQSPICAGGPPSVTGMGIQNAAKVWMEGLMLKQTFWEYKNARVATLTAVKQLWPNDCAKFDTVKGAWDGISVPVQAGEPTRPEQCGANNSFSMRLSSSSGTVQAGQSVAVTVSTAVVSGKAEQITFSAEGLPTGVTATFNPTTVTTGQSTSLTLSAAASAPAGDKAIVVKGTAPSGAKSETYALSVQNKPATCSGQQRADAPIKDGATTEGSIAIADCARTGDGVAQVEIDHTYIGDLTVKLVAPDGNATVLHNRTGGSADNIHKSFAVSAGGKPVNGTWKLLATDHASGDTGTLRSWSLSFGDDSGGSVCARLKNVEKKTLAAKGEVILPSNGGQFNAPAGRHAACLDGPDGTDFDLYLQRLDGTAWTTVKSAASTSADESLTYEGAAGTYRYRVKAFTGQGEATIGYDTP